MSHVYCSCLFSGGRRGSSSNQSSSSSGTPVSLTSTPRHHADPMHTASPATTVDTVPSSKPGLKGWATEYDLSPRQQPVIMSGSHMTRTGPLMPAKSSPSLNHEEFANAASSTPRGYNPKSNPVLNMTKSTTDIPENVKNYENVTSSTSPISPTGYQKLPSRTVFEFTTSSSRRSPRNSYAGGSHYSSGSPRNSFSSGSPRNSYAGYSPYISQSSTTGFSPMSVTSTGSYRQLDSNHNAANSVQNQKLTGANTNSYDDTPSHSQTKNYDRRSLPPQFNQFRHDFQRENKIEVQKPLTSMPVTKEEDDLEKEVPNLQSCPPGERDLRPMYSPPAPPVRDISSLKYVKYTQSHEKYPSWPVTTAQPPQNLGPPIDTQQSDKGKDGESSGEGSDKNNYLKEKVRNSPVDKKSEEKQTRNQSDPFRQLPKKSFYTKRRPPKELDNKDVKQEGERFDEFCKTSKPGYPPPKLDPDGHNYGDEKYNIPSPPERDVGHLDEKSLVEKIAAVISPNSSYTSPYTQHLQLNMTSENSALRNNRIEAATSPVQQTPRIPGIYFQQAINAQNLLKSNNTQSKSMVDSGTSPIHSPTGEDKFKGLRTVNANPKSDSFKPNTERRGLIVKQLPYYNTSTQTDDSLESQFRSEQNESGNQVGNGQMSSLSYMASSTSNVRSDTSSQSSGIGSMNFSDQSSAGMLRKLSEEFYRGKLSGITPSEKRMSSASTYDDLRSPRSETQPGLREAESYSSVVIHAHESSGLFGRDDLGSSPSLASSRPEVSDNEHEPNCDYRSKHRYSVDSGLFLQKPAVSSSKSLPPRSLQDTRFTSESNLSSGSYSRNSHSQSLMHLDRQSGSLGEGRQFSQSSHSSSTSSRPRGSLEARSSGSRLGSDSAPGSVKSERSRPESDSVFYENSSKSPVPQEGSSDEKLGKPQSVRIGRQESMKMAFGTYDENEHHYATPYAHQRNNSEVLSPTARDSDPIHCRSMSFNDYMPMHMNQSDSKLGQIKEECSESRWQEAVQKSRSLSRESTANYENFSPPGMQSSVRNSDSDKSGSERKQEAKKGMRRTASEQIRPHKKDKSQGKHSDSSKGGYSSSSGESSKGNKSDAENLPGDQPRQQDLKKAQQQAVFEFVERKKKGSDLSSEPQSPKVKDTSPNFPPPPIPENKFPNASEGITSTYPQSPLGDITRRYKYTQQQRGESLRRTQSITSNSSRESDYMDMKRLDHERNYQTEWKRLRSMDGSHPRRPLSIGSDVSSLEGVQTSLESDPAHRRSSSETVPKHVSSVLKLFIRFGFKKTLHILLNHFKISSQKVFLQIFQMYTVCVKHYVKLLIVNIVLILHLHN